VQQPKDIPDPESINDVPVTVISEQVVPTINHENAAKVPVTYQDWRKEDTKVITYAIGNAVYKGIQVESREEAVKHCELHRGRILEANYVQGRAFFRVLKVK
jgi:hypothetical protein